MWGSISSLLKEDFSYLWYLRTVHIGGRKEKMVEAEFLVI